MRVEELMAWIQERDAIRVRRLKGLPRPWTSDPILQRYRFCNVRREDDAVTRWVAEYWRDLFQSEPHLWFAMVVARLFNLPDTLAVLPFPVPWRPAPTRRALRKRREDGHNLFNGAYMIRSRPGDKVEYLLTDVLGPLWAARKQVAPRRGDRLADFAERLLAFDGMGTFMTGQVVADLKYVPPLLGAKDWWTWAYSGPGSRRGLNRVCEHDVDAPWHEAAWHDTLLVLQREVNGLLVNPLHAQDLQNCLCEFDKYERVRLGEGRPKQLYNGTKELQ